MRNRRHRSTIRRSATAAAPFVFAVAAFAGCGGSDDDAPSPRSSATPAAAASPAATPTPIREVIPTVTGEVLTMPNGVQYIDVLVGDGASPQDGQSIVLRFTAWTPDGVVIGRTVGTGVTPPNLFPAGFAPDLAESMRTMKVGGKRRLLNLAYGPNPSTVWDIELVRIQ